jgi:response regulator of citrate/malate metabolism
MTYEKGIDRCMAVVKWAHRTKYWTRADLQDHFGISKTSALRYVKACIIPSSVFASKQGGGPRTRII